MKMTKELLIKRYAGDVSMLFPFRGKMERDYLKRMVANMEDFASDHDFGSMEELYAEFGNPKDAIYQYYTRLSDDELLCVAHARALKKRILWFSCALLLSALLFLCMLLQKEHSALTRESAVYATLTTTEIKE